MIYAIMQISILKEALFNPYKTCTFVLLTITKQ